MLKRYQEMSDVMLSLQLQGMRESDVKSELLMLLTSKPIEFLTEMPDWPNCVHVDLPADGNWPIPTDTLRVVLNNLVGSLAHKGVTPIDIGAVKLPEVYSIVVRT